MSLHNQFGGYDEKQVILMSIDSQTRINWVRIETNIVSEKCDFSYEALEPVKG